MRPQLILSVVAGIAIAACGDGNEVRMLENENNQLKERISSLESNLAEKEHRLAEALRARDSIEAEFKMESEDVIAELRKRMEKIDVVDAETASKNLELKNALESIEATEDRYAKIKEEAFGKVARLKEIMATYDPEWAFVDYNKTAKRIVQIAVDQESKIAELQKANRPTEAAGR